MSSRSGIKIVTVETLAEFLQFRYDSSNNLVDTNGMTIKFRVKTPITEEEYGFAECSNCGHFDLMHTSGERYCIRCSG